MKQKVFQWLMLVVVLITTGNLQLSAQKVHTLGDSTMQPYDENTTGTRGWGMYFGNFLTNGWSSVNYAKGGRDARGGYNELWQNAKNNVQEGDYVLIQFAHNDTKYDGMDNLELQEYYTKIGDATNAASVKSDGRGTTPSTTYKACLKQIVDEVKAKNAIPVLVSAVCRCNLSSGVVGRSARHDLGGKFSKITDDGIKTNQSLPADDHTMDYTYQMKQLATELGVQFIDMTAATKSLYESYGTQEKLHAAFFDKGPLTSDDNTHYNLTGALTAARLCAQLMKEAGILAENIEIPTDLAFNPSTADLGDIYVGQSGIKELTLSGLGLDPATGTATITATEGIQLSADKENWVSEITADYENGTLIKTIYAKVMVNATGTFNGTVTATIGEKSVEVPLTVNGIELGGGDPFTATWALTSNDAATVVESGLATATDAKIEGMVKYRNHSTNGLMVSGNAEGAWVKAEDDSPNQYVQFNVTAPDGRKLDINKIAMQLTAWGGNGLLCHVYYSTDGFATRNTIYAPASMTNKEVNQVDVSPVISLEEGDQLQIRVYPWYNGNVTGKWLCISNVVIGGQSKDAAGVNISGSITYDLDKGGLTQGDDAVMDPNELSAGFVGKTWSAGSAILVEGTLSYDPGDGTRTVQTRIKNPDSVNSLPSTASPDNTLTLTLTPEEGFTFVPSKVSFNAARYGTDSGTINATVSAGSNSVDIVTGGDVNRSGKSKPLASFSSEVSGITVNADNPMKLNFSFLDLGKTKEMGLSNVVIEGTLVGAAAQVTKYVLNTQVVPAEAGSITREADLEKYKEGTVVSLKTTKNFGYKFKEWQDENGTVVSTDANTTVTMDAEKTMKAIFESVPVYKVTTEVTNDADREMGSITLSPNEHEGQYEEGTVITATANESKILKFLSWTDENENAGATATREITVNGDMKLVANYEVQDFIAVFDGSTTIGYASSGGYPFSADYTWDSERNAKSQVVKASDGTSLVGTNSKPVIRNRPVSDKAIVAGIGGLFENGYKSTDIAFQYQFSTKGFTTATFEADMAAKNMANVNWKAMVSTDGTTFTDIEGGSWAMAANTATPMKFDMPANQDLVYVRITGVGEDMLSNKYTFDQTSAEGLPYCSNSETMIGNVFVTGTAEVVPDAEAPVVTATIPADMSTGVSASGKITISFDERIQAVEGAESATLNDVPMVASWNNRSVSFEYTGLDYNTAYTFSMPANFVEDRSGNKYADALTIHFTTMNKPTVAKGLYDKVVSSTEELSAAITEANSRDDKTTRYRIFVKKGTYKMPTGATKHYVHKNNDGTVIYWEGDLPDPITYITAANISLIGEDRDATIITQDISNDDDMLFAGAYGNAHKYEEIANSAVFQLEGNATGTYFQDITIKSGINDNLGRNLAIHDKSSKTIYKNTLLYGYQDTWTSNNNQGLYYFEDGQVRGRTDYLCGKGDAYFKGLELLQVAGGYAIVPSTPAKIGWVFKDCTISGEGSSVSGNYTLGRPWGKGTPTAYLIDTKMNVLPSAVGWNEMSGGWPNRMAEWNSTNSKGAAVDLTGRKTIFAESHENNPVLTEEEATTYSNMTAMFGDWQPTLATEQAPVPANVTATGTNLSWEGSDYALLYAICKDGNVIDFTTETTYAATENGTYSVRAANEMGGLGAMSATAEITEATGIVNVYQNENAAWTDGSWYTINGQKLSGKPTQRGIYISGGRKVVVK